MSSVRQLCSASMDPWVVLWDIPSQSVIRRFEGHIRGVSSLGYSTDYRFLVSAGLDQNVSDPFGDLFNASHPNLQLRSLLGLHSHPLNYSN